MMRAAVLLAALTPLALSDYHPAAFQEFFASPVPRAVHRAALFEADTGVIDALLAPFVESKRFRSPFVRVGDDADQTFSIDNMFDSASAFDQDLGWCVNDGVDLNDRWGNSAFKNTPCESTSCGVNWAAAVSCGGSGRAKIDDGTIKTAVGRWLLNPAAAEASYGHISTWETAGVTDMSELFCALLSCGYYGCAAVLKSNRRDASEK